MTEGTYSAGVFALPCLDKYSTTESHAIVKFLRNNYEGIINSIFLCRGKHFAAAGLIKMKA